MYSEEIQRFIEERNGVLNRDEYMEITPITSPQINRVTYDTYNNKFIVYTSDGYKFEFIVRNSS